MFDTLLNAVYVDLSSRHARKERADRHAAFDARFEASVAKTKADNDAFFARARARQSD